MKTSTFLLAALLLAAPIVQARTHEGQPLVVLIAGRPSHGPGEHEHNAGVQLLAKCLAQGAPTVATRVHLNAEWPAPEELAQADTIVIYSDGQNGHPGLQGDHLESLRREMNRGCGLVCLHYAVEPMFEPVGWPAPTLGPDGKPTPPALVPGRGSKGKGTPELLEWLGGYFEQFWSVNPHWAADFTALPRHPISSGVRPFSTTDEWYYHIRFRDGMKGVTPILTALPGKDSLERPDGDHSGNPEVRREVLEEKKPQHVAWAVERENGGRGFGFTGGHFHKGWGNDDQRKLVLNAIVWTAKAEVPASGIESKVTPEDLDANLDPKRPPKPPAAKPRADTPPAKPARYGLDAAKRNMGTFTTPDGLQASLVAAEPMIQNPTSLDIDPQGRLWLTECVNYRKYTALRPAGDRVVILEDTDGDGIADREVTFFQDPRLTNPLGICVLPGPGGAKKGTQVLVSAAPNLWLLTDTDGTDRAGKAEILLKVGGNWNHDHQLHAFTFGFDGKLYFNMGNEAHELKSPDGTLLTDLAGHRITSDGKPYRGGMVFRADLTGGQLANIETLAWNFRNNYKVAVDSFGGIWQSDNDDDGNKAVRINYVMEYGNYGFTDEMTGASWEAGRTNLEKEIPLRHWHQNDPGVVPNLLQTGGGSPTGILVNDGSGLGPRFAGQLIHCDAGPRTVRAYPLEKRGAGYAATMADVLTSTDPWYRPSDLAIAPDGSLFVADWYDPGVGGHGMGDHETDGVMGRIYRVAATGAAGKAPTPDFTTADGAVAALQSPNRSTAYVAWQALHDLGAQAAPALEKLAHSDQPRFRARALGLLARIPGSATDSLRTALSDADSDVRVAAVRLSSALQRAGQLDTSPLEDDTALVEKLLRDPSPQVRRQVAISLHDARQIAPLWTALAMQYDGHDRWYLEALGIGSVGNEDACFDAWIAAGGAKWNTPAGRDIVWRVRSSHAAGYLAKFIADENLPAAEKPRFIRAFDFLPSSPEKIAALTELALLDTTADDVSREAFSRLKGVDLGANPKLAALLQRTLDRARSTPQFIGLVRDFGAQHQAAALLETALAIGSDAAVADAVRMLFADPDGGKVVADALAGPKTDAVIALLGATATPQGLTALTTIASDAQQSPATRQQAVRALARTQPGAEALIKLARNNQLAGDLTATAGSSLRLVQYASLKGEIDELFPAPATLGGKPLAAIPELVKIPGDIAKGRAIFERAESSCITCHRVNDKGVDFAPALSEIGTKLPKEAIYDAIINPNASVTMGFEATQLALKDGGVGLGIVRSETKDELVLALPGGTTTNFRKADIVKREKLATSLMPSGLNQALTQDDLVNLVEYLGSLKKQ
jgi:putative membrane-bound dehydrogenase-like protein